MRFSSLCKGVALAAAIFVLPFSANASRCDGVYHQAYNDCKAARASQCNQARHDARRACRYEGRHNCHSAKRNADSICSARGCRSQAESARSACYANRHHHGYR